MFEQRRYESPVPEEKKTNLRELLLERSRAEAEKESLARTTTHVIIKELKLEKLLGEEIKDFKIDVNLNNTVNVTLSFERKLSDDEAKAMNDLLYTIDGEARERGVHFQVE